MVARTPPKQRKMAAPLPPSLNPNLLRETIKKVDQCMARLQELQYTVSGGSKVVCGKNLSPRSTRAYLKTSIRCKQESLRMKNSAAQKSPVGKFQRSVMGGEWRRMSLPAMLVGETVGEILQASQFTREVVRAVAPKPKRNLVDDPKTPMTQRRNRRPQPEDTGLRDRRKREKQVLQLIRSESDSPSLQRARSRINFKVSPNKKRELGKENCLQGTPNKRDLGKENWLKGGTPNRKDLGIENWRIANRVSPKNRPWAKKTVLFPNPLFHSSPTSHQNKFCKTRSPVIARTRQSPHKFLIKSPPSNSKFQVKIKNPPVSLSPTRAITLSKKSPKMSVASKLRRSLSPARLANRLVSPLKNRMSPMKNRTVKNNGSFISGLKQCPSSNSLRCSDWRA